MIPSRAARVFAWRFRLMAGCDTSAATVNGMAER